MDDTEIKVWLHKSLRTQVVLNTTGGLATVLAGGGVLALTWGAAYVVSIFALGSWIGYHHWVHLVVGLVLIPLLFWGNARTSREYLSEYSVTTSDGSDRVTSFYLPGVGMVSNINPLAPDTIHSGAKMITDILYSGPRIVTAGFRVMSKARRQRRIDVEACSAVIAALLAARRKLSFQEIIHSVPWINPVEVFPQLHEIEGILFLAADPPGLTLSQEMRQLLLSILKSAPDESGTLT